MLIIWANAALTFAVTTWETYHTGVMVLPEINGPNEGLAGLYVMHGLTAAVGQTRRAPHTAQRRRSAFSGALRGALVAFPRSPRPRRRLAGGTPLRPAPLRVARRARPLLLPTCRFWTSTQLTVGGYRVGSIELALLISGASAAIDSLVRLWNITRRAGRGELHCTPVHALVTILPVPSMARAPPAPPHAAFPRRRVAAAPPQRPRSIDPPPRRRRRSASCGCGTATARGTSS